MGKSPNGSEYERLKEELRRMKRLGAPWYFESALHQRLHGGRRRRRRLRPISIGPVLVVAVVTLAVLAFALYAVLVRSNLFPGGTNTPLPQDSLSEPVRPDSVRMQAPRPAAHPRETPRAETHLPRTPVAETDSLPAHALRAASPGRDSVAAPPDTSASRKDTVSHARDTTGRRRDGGGVKR